MNELKPEDVMRALECCKSANTIDCDGCPYKGTHDAKDFYIRCRNFLIRDALALLRENDAHIKMLDEDRMGWADEAVKAQMKVNEKDAEIERLTKLQHEAEQRRALCENLCYPTYKELVKDQRAEAITEFAERADAEFSNRTAFSGVDVRERIAKIAKEMKEVVT